MSDTIVFHTKEIKSIEKPKSETAEKNFLEKGSSLNWYSADEKNESGNFN